MAARVLVFAALVAAILVSQALAASGPWTVQLNPPMGIIASISCSNATSCLIAGASNDQGSQIWRTDDGGATWNQLTTDGRVMIIFDIVMATSDDGVSSGVSLISTANQYTTDGQTFTMSNDTDFVTECQSAELITGTDNYGLTGTFGQVNGVAVSTNGGVTFHKAEWGLDFDARYGSFPSSDVWYIAGGDWPSDNQDDEFLHLSQRVHIKPSTNEIVFGRLGARDPPTNDTYYAGITVTTDGGQTFSVVFNQTGQYYFNQISCPSTTHCWAVAESDSDSPFNGAGVFASNDSGATWNMQYFFPQGSLIAMNMLNEQEGFAGGGLMTQKMVGKILHTTDGGQTWDETDIEHIYVNNFDFVDSSTGYATAFTESQGSVVISYKA